MNVIQCNNKLFIDGKEVKQPKSAFFKNCVCTVNNKIYVNGKEQIKSKDKVIYRSVSHKNLHSKKDERRNISNDVLLQNYLIECSH